MGDARLDGCMKNKGTGSHYDHDPFMFLGCRDGQLLATSIRVPHDQLIRDILADSPSALAIIMYQFKYNYYSTHLSQLIASIGLNQI